MRHILARGRDALSAALADETLLNQLETLAEWTATALSKGGKILICGNGGSAAEAQHIAAEFVGRYKKERKGLPSIALTTDTSILTAVANDYGYETIFARQIEALGSADDILIGMSTSGNSPNCLLACDKAKEMGIKSVVLTGMGGGKLKAAADLTLCVPSEITSHVQEVHLVILHALCERLDERPASV